MNSKTTRRVLDELERYGVSWTFSPSSAPEGLTDAFCWAVNVETPAGNGTFDNDNAEKALEAAAHFALDAVVEDLDRKYAKAHEVMTAARKLRARALEGSLA